MNRIIKFRAWDSERSIWLNESSWEGNFDDFYFTDLNKVLSGFGGHIILMQFTGLLDKNGKEIYEGDTIVCDGLTRKVVFWMGCFVSVGVDDEGYSDQTMFRGQDFEVIGNIYENPELINNRT